MKILILSPLLLIGASEQYNWILSATAQALAAVFALYFTVLIFGTQAASRYNPRAFRDVFYRVPTILLVLLFIGAIISPLIFLHDPSICKAWIAIAGGAACLIFLATDFFFGLSNKLIPSRYVKNLEKKAKKNYIKAIGVLEDLRYAATRFYSTDTSSFNEALQGIQNIAISYAKGRVKDKRGLTLIFVRAIDILETLGKETIEHPVAPHTVIFHLSALYEAAGFDIVKNRAIGAAINIEELCTENRLRFLSVKCFEILSLAYKEKKAVFDSEQLNDLYRWQVVRILRKHQEKKWFDLVEKDIELLGKVVLGLAKRDSHLVTWAKNLLSIYIGIGIRENIRPAITKAWEAMIMLFDYAVLYKSNLISEFSKLFINPLDSDQAVRALESKNIEDFAKPFKKAVRLQGYTNLKELINKLERTVTLLVSNKKYKEAKEVIFILIEISEILFDKSMPPNEFNQLLNRVFRSCLALKDETSNCLRVLKRLVKLIPLLDQKNREDGLWIIHGTFLKCWKGNRTTELGKFVCPYIWLIRALYLKPQHGDPAGVRDEIIMAFRDDQELTDFFFKCIPEAEKLAGVFDVREEFKRVQEELRLHLHPSS